MAEPWTSIKSKIYGAGSYLRLLKATLTDGKDTEITSLAVSPLDLLEVVNEKPAYVGAASSSKEYIEGTLSSGVKAKLEKTTPTINAQTGYKMSADSDSYEKFEVTVWCSYSQFTTLLGYYRNGSTVFAMRSIGRKVEDRNIVGDEHILGKISEFDASPGEGFQEVKITITGGTVFTIKEGETITHSEYNALMTGSGNTIEPVGCEVITPEDLIADDFTSLLNGAIVQKEQS
jgi:hypothetical protein